MTAVLVPRLVALRPDMSARRQFIRELNGTLLVAGIGLAAFTWAAAPLASHLFASAARSATIDLTTLLCRTMSPVALLLLWTGYLSLRLQARERFAYTVTEAIPAVIIAFAVAAPLFAPAQMRLGWSTTVGYLAQLLVLSAMTIRMDLGVGGFALRHRSPEWSRLYRNVGVMVVGQVLAASAIPIDQAFAVRIGPGAVATLGYANRIVILVTGIGSVMVARALLPVLSRTIAEKQGELAVRQTRHWAWLLFGAAMALALAIWILAPWAVSLIFERGAFTRSDADAVAKVLQLGTLQLPFYFAGLALVQWYSASAKYGILVAAAFAGIAAKVLLNTLLAPRFGVEGIMVSTAAMYMIVALFLAIGQLNRNRPGI